ncbi:hypothetical protein ACNKHR_25875 [Shigella flexneri]
MPIAATFAGAPSLTVDAVIVPCGNIADPADNGDANYYLMEAYKTLRQPDCAGGRRAELKQQSRSLTRVKKGLWKLTALTVVLWMNCER